jgi:Carboxypeptidase regulatory-like domain
MRYWTGSVSLFRAAVWAVVALASAGVAQAQLTRGIVSGTVRDQSGAAIPGANVTVTNVATNISRSVVTNDSGFYRAPALEPGSYKVKVEIAGFGTVEQSVRVESSLEATLNVGLKVGSVGEELNVTGLAETVSLNKSNPTLGSVVPGKQAVELPLSAARNIDNLALLQPNTFRAPGSTTIAAAGSRARNNNYMIDGSDNNDISVTLRTSPVVPEGVQEVVYQTNAYNAEFGRNSGLQSNVITKSGTNQFQGQAWDYYRTAGLNALSNLEKGNKLVDPPKSVRHQLGAYLSGPLIKDKTFFFGLYQRDTTRTGDILPANSFTMPTPAGYAALQNVPLRAGQSVASRQAALGAIQFLNGVYAKNPVFSSTSTTLVNGVPVEVGVTTIGAPTPNTTPYILGRLDHQAGPNDNLTLRYIQNEPNDTNATSNLQFGSLFAADQIVKEKNAALSYTHVFNYQALNELRVSYIKRDLQFPENDPTTPTSAITGLFTIGGSSNFPQGRVQDSYQFSDIFTLTRGHHNFKIGADVRRIVLDNDAAFNSKGSYTFDNLQAYMNNTASTFTQALNVSSFKAKQWQTFLFAQDDVHVTSDLVVNLGLRYEITTVPLGFFGATDAESLAAQVPPPVKQDKNNWAPRVGFNWSPRSSGFLGDGKTVFRGGYGITYDVLFYNILTVNASNFPRVFTGSTNNVVDVFPSVAAVGGSPAFNPLAQYVNSPEDLQAPKQQIYSLDVQREIGRDFVLQIGYAGSTGSNGINQLQGNPAAVVTPEQAALVASTKSTTAIPSVQARRLFPQFGSRVLIASTAKSQYHAGFLSLRKRMSHGLEFGLSYTLSRLMSDNDESLGVGDITNGSPQIPQDFGRIQDEWSLSAFDRTHRLAVSYTYQVPSPKSGILKQILGGWQISGVTQGQSGQPFTIVTGVDSNGNGSGGDRPNVDPSGGFTIGENGRTFVNSGRYVAPLGTNNLPLLYALGNGNEPRNSLRTAPFWNTDLSVSKRFESGRHRVTLRVDFLNAFNQDETRLPTTSMSSVNFGKNLNNWGNRSITLGVKYGF